MVLCALACQYFQQSAQITGGYIECVGDILNGGQTLFNQVIAIELFRENIFQPAEDLMVGYFSR